MFIDDPVAVLADKGVYFTPHYALAKHIGIGVPLTPEEAKRDAEMRARSKDKPPNAKFKKDIKLRAEESHYEYVY